MSGDAHVRFWESEGAQFTLATHPLTTGCGSRRIRAFSSPESCRSPRDDDAQAAAGGRRGHALLPLHFPLRQAGFPLRRGRHAPQGLIATLRAFDRLVAAQ